MIYIIIVKIFSIDTIFFPNLSVEVNTLSKLPPFFQKIVVDWIEISQHNPSTASLILSESLWYNSKITIDNKSLSPAFFGLKNIVFVKDLFDNNGDFITWDDFALEFNLEQL